MSLWPQAFAALFAFAVGSGAAAKAAEPSPDAIWADYKAHFLSDDGRIVDEADGADVSHSEGQGYGLLLAAFHGDRAAFGKMLAWTQANLYVRGDDLAAWRWRPGDSPHALDLNNATDGDILIAWALAEAGRRFGRPDYTERARRIAHVVAWSLTAQAGFGLALSPGKLGFGPKDGEDGPVVNPSYWIYPAFTALQKITPEVDWAKIAGGGRALLDAAKFGPAKLPADWISIKGVPAPAKAYPARFGYDAIRVPLYLIWDDPGDRGRIAPFAMGWAPEGGAAPSTMPFEPGVKAETLDAPGYRAIAALVRCVAKGEEFPAELRSPAFERYYPSTLHMLALTALREKALSCA